MRPALRAVAVMVILLASVPAATASKIVPPVECIPGVAGTTCIVHGPGCEVYLTIYPHRPPTVWTNCA